MKELNLLSSEKVKANVAIKQQKEIGRIYDESYQRITKQIERIENTMQPSNEVSSKMKIEQLKALRTKMGYAYRENGKKVKAAIADGMEEVSRAVISDVDKINKQLGLPFEIDTIGLSKDVVENVVLGRIYQEDWTLSKAIWSDSDAKHKEINKIVAAGIAEGKSSLELAQDLEKYVDPKAKKEWAWKKVYPGTSTKIDYNAQRLARTMVSHAYQQALVESTKDNPFVKGIKWHSADIHDRTCELCKRRASEDAYGLGPGIYPKDKVPLDHPNGLCTLVPVVDEPEDVADKLIDWLDGKENKALDKYAERITGKKFNSIDKAKIRDKKTTEEAEKYKAELAAKGLDSKLMSKELKAVSADLSSSNLYARELATKKYKIAMDEDLKVLKELALTSDEAKADYEIKWIDDFIRTGKATTPEFKQHLLDKKNIWIARKKEIKAIDDKIAKAVLDYRDVIDKTLAKGTFVITDDIDIIEGVDKDLFSLARTLSDKTIDHNSIDYKTAKKKLEQLQDAMLTYDKKLASRITAITVGDAGFIDNIDEYIDYIDDLIYDAKRKGYSTELFKPLQERKETLKTQIKDMKAAAKKIVDDRINAAVDDYVEALRYNITDEMMTTDEMFDETREFMKKRDKVKVSSEEARTLTKKIEVVKDQLIRAEEQYASLFDLSSYKDKTQLKEFKDHIKELEKAAKDIRGTKCAGWSELVAIADERVRICKDQLNDIKDAYDAASGVTKVSKARLVPKSSKKRIDRAAVKNTLDGLNQYAYKTKLSDKCKRQTCQDAINNVKKAFNIKSDAEAVEAIENRVNKLISNSDVGVRINSNNLQLVLGPKGDTTGRFKNLYETGRSGGCCDMSTRNSGERKVFNVPAYSGLSKDEKADMPTYGMLMPKMNRKNSDVVDYYKFGPGDWYGDGTVVIMNKSKIINNTSICFGDSLDYEAYTLGSEMANYKFNGSTKMHSNRMANLLKDTDDVSALINFTEEDWQNDLYIECQMYGKETHSVESIEKILFSKDIKGKLSVDTCIERLEELGIPYEFY